MNGKYIMLYALIVAAMLALLVISLFDWRFLNCDKPLRRNGPSGGQLSVPAATARRSQPQHHSEGFTRQSDLKQIPKDRFDQQSRRDPGYILTEGENGECQILHRDGSVVDYIELRLRLEETNRMQVSAVRPDASN